VGSLNDIEDTPHLFRAETLLLNLLSLLGRPLLLLLLEHHNREQEVPAHPGSRARQPQPDLAEQVEATVSPTGPLRLRGINPAGPHANHGGRKLVESEWVSHG
jgi:hypothetical protein